MSTNVRYHFSSLAHDNDALSSSITSVRRAAPSPQRQLEGPIVLEGRQRVAKFNKAANEADDVLILLALWRIPGKKTDMVLTVNFPLAQGGKAAASIDDSEARRAFEAFVGSLEVKDWGLFAG